MYICPNDINVYMSERHKCISVQTKLMYICPNDIECKPLLRSGCHLWYTTEPSFSRGVGPIGGSYQDLSGTVSPNIGMAYSVIAYTVRAHIVVAYIVMASGVRFAVAQRPVRPCRIQPADAQPSSTRGRTNGEGLSGRRGRKG